MARLFGLTSETSGREVSLTSRKMARLLTHRPGQSVLSKEGSNWAAGVVTSASGTAGRIIELGKDATAIIAGTPIFSRSEAVPQKEFQCLLDLLFADDETLRAWFERIDGLFAFALVDHLRNVLFLANDRYGGLPLYTASGGGAFYWASEVKAVAQCLGSLEIDRTQLQHFVNNGYVRPPFTYYPRVTQVPERSAVWYDLQKGSVRWVEVYRPKSRCERYQDISYSEAKNEFKQLTTQAVRSRINACGNGEAVVTLSGGLDSRLLLAEARRLGANIRAVTYGQPSSHEVSLARRVAKVVAVPHQVISVDGSNWLDEREAAVWMTDGMMDIAHSHIIHVAPYLETHGVILDGLFGDVVLGRGAITVDAGLTSQENRYLRMNRFTYFGPRIEQNYATVATPLIDMQLVEFMDALPSEMTAGGRLYRDAVGEEFPRLFKDIAWLKTGRPPSPYVASEHLLKVRKLRHRAFQAARWMGLPITSRRETMDYFGWFRLPYTHEMFKRLLYHKSSHLIEMLKIPSLETLFSRVPMPMRAQQATRFLTLEVWLRQANEGRLMTWKDLLEQ